MNNFNWDEFFYNWKKDFNVSIFAKDGIICPSKYENVLFVLKDVNNAKPGDNIDLRKSLVTRTDEGKTWFDITVWAAALLDGTFLKDVTHDMQHKYMKRIAVMNLKKEAGGPQANSKEIRCYACKHHDNILTEIKQCNPKLIVACSRVVFEALAENVFLYDKKHEFDKMQFTDRMNGYGRYFEISESIGSESPTFVIEYRHPNQCGRQGTREEHFCNMKDIRNKFLNNLD